MKIKRKYLKIAVIGFDWETINEELCQKIGRKYSSGFLKNVLHNRSSSEKVLNALNEMNIPNNIDVTKLSLEDIDYDC